MIYFSNIMIIFSWCLGFAMGKTTPLAWHEDIPRHQQKLLEKALEGNLPGEKKGWNALRSEGPKERSHNGWLA